MYRSVICFVLVVCVLLAALAASAPAAYVVRISDLQCSPTPPNPIKVAGRVMSASPLKLNDGTGEITVVGTTAAPSDFLVVTGDWDGSVLTVSGALEQVLPPAPCEMVYVPAGRFLMGSNGSGPYGRSDEIPQHPVYLCGYWLGKKEVTRREYLQFMEAGGYSNPAYWSSDGSVWRTQSWRAAPIRWFPEQDWGTGTFVQTDEHPVVGVTYCEAEAYCSWAGGHLPSEGQWEKAASWTGGYPNTWPWGNLWDAETCNNAVDHNPAGGGFGQCQTAPVGSYPSGASPYGLHDMAGNVWEWCRDWHDFDYYSVSPSITPMGPLTGVQRVLRGGSWRGMESHTRCSVRYSDYPRADWDDDAGGFRLAR